MSHISERERLFEAVDWIRNRFGRPDYRVDALVAVGEARLAELSKITMIENVARAMWEQRRKFAAIDHPDIPLDEWGDGSVPKANGIMEEARAAIESMRVSTDAMYNAAAPLTDEECVDQDCVWQAMIDAALSEVPV